MSFSGCLELKQTAQQSPTGIQGNGAGYGGENGAGYGGGDDALSYARQLVVRSLIQFRDKVDSSYLGNVQTCQLYTNSPAICNLLVSLSPPQLDYIKSFLNTQVQTLLDMNLGSDRVKFEFSSNFLTLPDQTGEVRDLAAKTKLGRSGSVIFNSDNVQTMNDWQRVQLIVHELGHKLEKIDATHPVLDDDSVIGPFSSGKLFLDTLGAALVSYLAGGVGKTIVSFPTQKSCDAHTTEQILAAAPYFSNQSQEAIGLLPALQTVSDSGSDFTLTAWVRVFNDLQSSDSNYYGQVLFSNKDFEQGIYPGLQLFRLKNGNFGAYGGTGRIIDSGIKLAVGGYHLVSVKRTQNKFYLTVDGLTGNSDTATYFDSYDAIDKLAGLIELGSFTRAKAMIGAPGNNPSPPASGVLHSNGYPFHQFDFWKGNIASLSLYSSALTDDELKSLFQCAPTQYRVTPPTEVGPGYPIPTPGTDGRVMTMLLNNGILYLGGAFENFTNQPRYRLAAINTQKSNTVTSWAPVVHGDEVKTMAISGNTLFLGGAFIRVNGQARQYLAAVDLTTGALLPWSPNPDYNVNSLAVSGNYLFVAGEFSKFDGISGNSTKFIASFDISNLNKITLRSWPVVPDSKVNTVLASGNRLYLGGYFSQIGSSGRNMLAAVDIETGALTDWNPSVTSDGSEVYALAKIGDTLYAGGNFSQVGDKSRASLVAVKEDGTITDWAPSVDSYVYTLSPSMQTLFVGGSFSQVNGQTRNRAAEINISDGTLTPWNPNANSSVYSILPQANRTLLGGEFTLLNGLEARYFATMQN